MMKFSLPQIKELVTRGVSLEVVAILVCVGACIRIIYLGKLPLYIHPSMNIFAITGVIALGIIGVSAVVTQKSSRLTGTVFQRSMLFAVAGVLLFVENRGLSPALAEFRSTGDIVPVTSRAGIRVNALTQQFTILEWIAAWEGDPSGTRYLGSRAEVEGFITQVDGIYYVNRYVVTCCAVDAQVVRLRLDGVGEGAIDTAQWYRVSGSIDSIESRPVIVVKEAEKISEPEVPYLY